MRGGGRRGGRVSPGAAHFGVLVEIRWAWGLRRWCWKFLCGRALLRAVNVQGPFCFEIIFSLRISLLFIVSLQWARGARPPRSFLFLFLRAETRAAGVSWPGEGGRPCPVAHQLFFQRTQGVNLPTCCWVSRCLMEHPNLVGFRRMEKIKFSNLKIFYIMVMLLAPPLAATPFKIARAPFGDAFFASWGLVVGALGFPSSTCRSGKPKGNA